MIGGEPQPDLKPVLPLLPYDHELKHLAEMIRDEYATLYNQPDKEAFVRRYCEKDYRDVNGHVVKVSFHLNGEYTIEKKTA